MAASTTGQLLIATPAIRDGIFDESVIYMIHHDDNGALGVVLTQPMLVPAAEVLPQWAELLTPPDRLFTGGPVEPNGVIGLARLRDSLDGAPAAMAERITTIDLDGDPALTAAEIDRLRLFRGYSGWAPGQLEGELAADAWFIAEALFDDLFCPDPAELCERVLRRQPGSTRWFANAPTDPSVN